MTEDRNSNALEQRTKIFVGKTSDYLPKGAAHRNIKE
jgi:hypothetical protein